jgi:small-conductance mechanosensitive channel
VEALGIEDTSESLIVAAHGGMPTWIRRLQAVLSPEYWESVLWAVGLGALAFFLGKIVAWSLYGAFERWARATTTPADDVIVKHLGPPLRWVFPFAALGVALPGLELGKTAHATVRQILVVLIILNMGWLLFRIVRVIEDLVGLRLTVDGAVRLEDRSNYTQLRGFRNIAGFLIGVVTLGLALLSFTGVRQIGTSMLASAGVAGVVIGFAAQRSIAAIVSGLVISISQPIRIDDVVVVEGESGEVEEINLTHVVVRLWDQRRMVLPINHFLEKPFENWSRPSNEIQARVVLYFDYTLPLGALREEFRRVLAQSEYWDKRSSAFHVADATDRCLVIRLQMSARDAPTAWELRCEMREKLITYVREKHAYALPQTRQSAAATLGPGDGKAKAGRLVEE